MFFWKTKKGSEGASKSDAVVGDPFTASGLRRLTKDLPPAEALTAIGDALRRSTKSVIDSDPFLKKYWPTGIIGAIQIGGINASATLHSSIAIKEGAKLDDIVSVLNDAIKQTEARRIELDTAKHGSAYIPEDGYPMCLNSIHVLLEVGHKNSWTVQLVPSGYTLDSGCNVDYVKHRESAEEKAELMLTARTAIVAGLGAKGIEVLGEAPGIL